MEENKTKLVKKEENQKKKSKSWIYIVGIIIIILIILLLLHSCIGKGKNYKIKLHYGDDVLEVDKDFDLSKLEVGGGEVTFLVDSDGHIVDPKDKLNPDKEYSAHIVPNGKQKVKVTYKTDSSSLVIEYQKGSGLLFPEDPVKKGYIFIGWKDESIDDYPIYMMPVEHDMTLVAVFEKSTMEGGKCTLNCDTNNDGKCDLNCDKNGDGKPDTNIDTDGDGKCDSNCKNTEMNYKYMEGELNLSCETKGFSLFMNKSSEFVNAKYDGKVIEPDEWNMNANDEQKYAEWTTSIAEYFKSGKIVTFVSTLIKTDATGQKYYSILTAKFNFEGNCKKGEEEKNDIPSTDGTVQELHYNCDTPHGVILYWEKDRIQSVTIDGKKANPGKYNEKNYPTYDLRKYKGSGRTIYLNAKVTDYENKDYEFTVKLVFSKDCDKNDEKKTYTLTYNANGGSISPKNKSLNEGASYGNLPTPTRSGYTFDGWFTSASGGNKVSSSTIIKANTTIYAHWTEIPQDNGTISLNARNTCLVKGQATTIMANVNNAIDATVDWLGDSCLSISSQGNTATVRGNNCGVHPTVTGRLHNGAKDTVTLNYEDTLTVTITDTSGNKVSPSDGVYYGNNLTITSNVSAYITGSYLSGDSGSLRTSAKTQGAAGTTVTVRTACGQTKSITISPIIN